MEYLDIFDENNKPLGIIKEKVKYMKMVIITELHMYGL